MNYFIKNLLLWTVIFTITSNNSRCMENIESNPYSIKSKISNTQQDKIITYEVNVIENQPQCDVELLKTNDYKNSKTLQELSSTSNNFNSKYQLLNKNIIYLKEIFNYKNINLNKLLNDFKIEKFNWNVNIPNELCKLLKYKNNNINIQILLIDIKNKLNELSTTDEEEIRRKIDGEFYEGSYNGPISACSDADDTDYYGKFSQHYSRLLIQNNIMEYEELLKYLIDILNDFMKNNSLIKNIIINEQDISIIKQVLRHISYMSDGMINKKANTLIDTIIDNINNIKTLSEEQIKEKIINYYNNISIGNNVNNYLDTKDFYYNAVKINNYHNQISKCYDKYFKSKFVIKDNYNNKDKYSEVDLLLAKCAEEFSNITSNTIKYIENINSDFITFPNENIKQVYSQIINNLKSN